MNEQSEPVPVLDSVGSLAERYEVWLTDIWGVMHDGMAAHENACEALMRFRETGGIVFLISNSPRPSGPVQAQMAELGVPREAYDGTVTSGDVTRGLIAAASGTPIFHLGPARDLPLFEGLDPWLVDQDEAELVILTGLYDDDTETPDDYAGLLAELHKKQLPVICANPDMMVEKGDRLIYCAGALAEAFEKLGGQVVYAGKPHLPIYDLAHLQINELAGRPVPRKNILGIGDGPKTDMAGAAAAGLDTLFIARGVARDIFSHGKLQDPAALEALFEAHGFRPVAIQMSLQW